MTKTSPAPLTASRPSVPGITPCLWFDSQAEEAASFYTSVFPDSRIIQVTHYTEAGYEIHGKPAGSVLTVVFEIAGQRFTALNGGPLFQFTEAVSLEIHCDTQEEIDYYWDKLSQGGEPGSCGWLKDRYGLSWQVNAAGLNEMLTDPDPARCNRVMEALLPMGKLEITLLKAAFESS